MQVSGFFYIFAKEIITISFYIMKINSRIVVLWVSSLIISVFVTALITAYYTDKSAADRHKAFEQDYNQINKNYTRDMVQAKKDVMTLCESYVSLLYSNKTNLNTIIELNNKNPQLNWDQLYGAKKWIQASENSINEYLNNKNEYQIRYGFTYSNMNVKVSGY